MKFLVRLQARFQDEPRLGRLGARGESGEGRVGRRPVWLWREGGERGSREHRSEGLIHPPEQEFWRMETSGWGLRSFAARGRESGGSERSVSERSR